MRLRDTMMVVVAAGSMLSACNNLQEVKEVKNPFFTEYNTPYQVPDFTNIKNDDYLPAFEKGIEEQQKEIAEIVNNSQEPTFQNTIEALDKSGQLLTKVSNVFFNLQSANTNDTIKVIAKTIAPLLSKHHDDINLNKELFERVKSIYDNRSSLKLTTEQNSLLDKTYKGFVRGGANLQESQKDSLRNINKELSLLSLKFGDNLLNETNAFQLVIENEEDLSGLPEGVKSATAQAAKEENMEGKWLFTLHKPSMVPFLQYAENRDLREQIYKAYLNRANNNNESDNNQVVAQIATLRLQKAKLLGYNNFAAYSLEPTMAKTPEKVNELLNKLWKAALPKAKQEVEALQAMIKKEGNDFKLESWDWWYYTEKLKKEKYSIDASEVRQYFSLDNVRNGLFDVVNKLYGIKLIKRDDIPVYHPEVEAYEVQEVNGKHVGVLYMDFFPRASKRGGAWMTSYRKQYKENGTNITPVISIVCNFTKPTGDTPALLSFDEVETFFHEFGHALHGLLSDCQYETLSGTSVSRDFVELPSQILENWAGEGSVMRNFAKHYKTGEPIPAELINKMESAAHFNQGFATVEYLAASILDMDWHTVTNTDDLDAAKFEKKAMDKIGLIPEIAPRYKSTYFQHIFRGGYAAGYYSYIWSEILDADAFDAFKETTLFDKETANSFRKNILEKGGSEDPMELYKKFRGREPSIEPLLRRRGLRPIDRNM
ncbi:M3 family metallopeptidase [Limibacter armeniacum]|uniref:M3 family metallopeptidase n=1 Tax=Limibacter armeniacum TaxID=466084 RepID=UPI002FE59FE4